MASNLKDTVDAFDTALAHYMAQEFGKDWRTQCHQSAKIAAYALRALHPDFHIEARRMELAAMMQGAGSYVHLGDANDPPMAEGKVPMHYAVVVGTGIYDPTFWQLSRCATPLDLPEVPYFYVDRCLEITPDDSGFRWVGLRRPTGLLGVGYKLQDIPLPGPILAKLMTEELAHQHGARVAARYKTTTKL